MDKSKIIVEEDIIDQPKCIMSGCDFYGKYLGTDYCSQCLPDEDFKSLPYSLVHFIITQKEEVAKRSNRIIHALKETEDKLKYFLWGDNKKHHRFHPDKIFKIFQEENWKELLAFLEYYCQIKNIGDIPMMKAEDTMKLSNLIYQNKMWLGNENLIRGIDSLLINMTWDYYRLNRPGFNKFPGECLCYLVLFGDTQPDCYDDWISMKNNAYFANFNKNRYYLKSFLLTLGSQDNCSIKIPFEDEKKCFICLENIKKEDKVTIIPCCSFSVYHLDCEKEKIKICPICRKKYNF